jgi:hypothetical protein
MPVEDPEPFNGAVKFLESLPSSPVGCAGTSDLDPIGLFPEGRKSGFIEKKG